MATVGSEGNSGASQGQSWMQTRVELQCTSWSEKCGFHSKLHRLGFKQRCRTSGNDIKTEFLMQLWELVQQFVQPLLLCLALGLRSLEQALEKKKLGIKQGYKRTNWNS